MYTSRFNNALKSRRRAVNGILAPWLRCGTLNRSFGFSSRLRQGCGGRAGFAASLDAKIIALMAAIVLTAGACGDDPEPVFGVNLSGLTYQFFDETEGVHPSTAVLDNPRNPFRFLGISDTTKFAILGGGGNAGAFYAWATLLVRQPTGEHQFFTANKLRDILEAGEVEGPNRETVRQMAINGYQAILDDFPDSVIFDSTGTQFFRLATPAVIGILDLNGEVFGDWVLVPDQNGDLVAIKGAGVDNTRPTPEAQ